MRLVFMGSPDFAVISLRRLLETNHQIAGVMTQPDRPQGRGRKELPTAVAKLAAENGLPLLKPDKLRAPATSQWLQQLRPDLFVVVAYRILPRKLLEIPKMGSVNLHGSLLPDWRGAAPIQRAIMAGESVTGLTTFMLNAGVDTGDILLQESLTVGPDEDFGSVHDRMAEAGAGLLLKTLSQLDQGTFQTSRQPQGEFRLAPKIHREDRLLDWRRSALDLHNQIRALSPLPGAVSGSPWGPLRIFATRVGKMEGTQAEPGTISEVSKKSFQVACGKGTLTVFQVQLAGKKRLDVQAFRNGHSLVPGVQLSHGE